MFDNLPGSRIDRRSFLKGSAMFAAAIGVSMALPAFAQQAQKPAPGPDENKDKNDKKQNPSGDDKKYERTLVDGEGREYRICPQCGYNMYKQKRLWVCENCGYSYAE